MHSGMEFGKGGECYCPNRGEIVTPNTQSFLLISCWTHEQQLFLSELKDVAFWTEILKKVKRVRIRLFDQVTTYLVMYDFIILFKFRE